MTNPIYDELFGCHADKTEIFIELLDGTEVSYQDFLELSAQMAHVLTQGGYQPGDRIAVQVEKSLSALALYAACVQAGLVFLPLNTAYTANELIYFVENSEAVCLVCDATKLDGLTRALNGPDLLTLNADGTGSLADLALTKPKNFETVDRQLDDLAAFLYTSGTTGRSKAAMLTQRNLLSNAKALKEAWRFTSADALLHALPIFHTHGLFVATNVTLAAGGKLIFLPRFDLDVILDRMGKATTMMGVPTFYTRLLGDARFNREAAEHMRLFISGSAPLLADTHIEFEERTGHKILERYGMTETNMNVSNPYIGDRRPGTVGLPLPGVEVKITDPNSGAELENGNIGQIEVRGENVFKGYWKMPEKTAEELRENGFFITGDLGRKADDGYLSIVGRDKDLIISGGYNIYPKEIELVLDEQPSVLESAVIGVPHPDFGETVLAVVVPSSGEQIEITEIEKAITLSLARFKHPRKIVSVPELPRNTMGKVQKNLLREKFKNTF